jgi:D-glycero-D-manno-heptose 1,7-bisphosphate phosphatase
LNSKAVFLDRDGVINREVGHYVHTLDEFEIIPGVLESLRLLKSLNYLLVVITNQAGISKGLYSNRDVKHLHQHMRERLDQLIDAVYYSPYHPDVTESLSRKPGTLLFERAIARYGISTADSWMIGDRERDLLPAKKLGFSTVAVGNERARFVSDHKAEDLLSASQIIRTG